MRRRERPLPERVLDGEVDWWDELYHQGDVFPETVEVAPLLVELVERSEPDVQADLLYFLAAAAVGRPERLAAQVGDAARAGAAVYRRLLDATDPDVRGGAVAALAVVGPDDVDVVRLAELATVDDSPLVRSHAALALGLVPGSEQRLVPLLEDAVVAHPAALALARLGRADERVVETLARALIAIGESPTERPPWDALYPDWTEELTTLGDAGRTAIPLLEDAIADAEPWLAEELARVVGELSDGGSPRPG